MRAALLAAALLAPSLAFGQTLNTINTSQGRLDISGESPSACLISSPTAASASNSTFSATGNQQGQITITQLADPQTAVALASTIDLDLPVICNTAHSVNISTANGGLTRLGAPASAAEVNGFRQYVPYQVSATWAGQTANATSQAGNTITINSSDGAAGQLDLVISFPGGGDPLVAGVYNDQVVIQLQVAS